MASSTPRRGSPPPSGDDFSESVHLQVMREIRDQQKTNNAQIGTLSEKVSAFVTAVEVMRVTQEAHSKAIDGLIEREEARAKMANDRRFTLGNNAVFWAIGGIGVMFGLINFIEFVTQHWR